MTDATVKDPQTTRLIDPDPMTVETLASGLTTDPTPQESFFVRNNLTPAPPPEGWTVQVMGTAEEATLTLDDIFGVLPRVEMPAVLQCAGNGRARLAEPVGGVQWQLGGMGLGDWSGVRVADVAAACGGVADRARFLTASGGDASFDDPERVERSVPLDKALADAILVDRLNGEPLAPVHGGPVRLLVPGYYAVNSVKWVRRLSFTESQSDALIQTMRYRYVPPGEEQSSAYPSVWEMGPQAVVLTATPDQIAGVAFSGGEPVVAVDVSADGGETWTGAELGPEQGRFGWRRFTAPGAGAGSTVTARARTVTAVQRRHARPTLDGYAIDGWEQLAAMVEPA